MSLLDVKLFLFLARGPLRGSRFVVSVVPQKSQLVCVEELYFGVTSGVPQSCFEMRVLSSILHAVHFWELEML